MTFFAICFGVAALTGAAICFLVGYVVGAAHRPNPSQLCAKCKSAMQPREHGKFAAAKPIKSADIGTSSEAE